MKLSVIIVSYNVKYYLEQCLLSVFKAAERGLDLEVVVVDNNSPDHSATYLRQRFPKCTYPFLHIIANTSNVGFGRANNQAIKMVGGDYVLFLNPDTILAESTLECCLQYAEQHPDLGGLGTMMLHDNGNFAYESRRGMPSPWVSFCKMSGLNALFPHNRKLGRYYMRYLNKGEAAEIEIISGAFMLIRRNVLEQVGGFDEDFFMYGEDIDLSYRILQAGFRNYYFPAPIVHYKGESTKKNTFRYVHVFYTAMLIFFKKHYHGYWIGFSLPIKAAIAVTGLGALLKLQVKMLRRFILPNKKRPRERMLYVGTHVEKMKNLACEWDLDVDCCEGDEGAEKVWMKDLVGHVRVIFDAADFSYEYMLQTLKLSEHNWYLGVFYSDKEILITGVRAYVPQSIEL